MKRRRRPAPKETIISESDRMKRVGTCCGIAGFFLACLVVTLNNAQHLQSWQVKLLAAILLTAIITTLTYGSAWTWIYNAAQKRKNK